MRNWIYIVLLNLGLTGISLCQVVPWTVVPTSNSQEIVLEDNDSTATYDNKYDTNGDAIGVFYDQGGSWVCGGYIVLDGINQTFLVYGNDAVDNGFQIGENYHLKYWRKTKNCIIDLPANTMSDTQYFLGGSDTIKTLDARPAVVGFPQTIYCTYTPGVIQLQVTNSTFSNISVQSILPPLIYYNNISGVIEDKQNVPPATYTFTVSTIDGQCLRSPTFDITIGKKLHLTTNITYTQPTCISNLGAIMIDTSSFTTGTKPFTLSLTDSINGNNYLFPSGIQSNLPPSYYKLAITDFYGCSDTSTVVIDKAICNDSSAVQPPVQNSSKNTILTPGQNNANSEVFFPWSGEVVIYDSRAMLVRKMVTPAVWDGTNNNGAVVGTGLYIVFLNDKKMTEITVIY